MDGKNMEFKVGLFVFIALLCLGIMIISFGIEGFQFGKKTYFITAVFKFTNGVIVGAPVRSAGVEVGKVEKVFFSPTVDNDVRIGMEIDNNIILRKDSRVIINSLGIIGEKYVEFIPQSIDAPRLKNGDIIKGENPLSMNDILKEGRVTLKDIKIAMSKLLDDENLDNVSKTIENIKNFTEKDIQEMKQNVQNSLDKIDTATESFSKLMNQIDTVISKNEETINQGFLNAKNAFEQIGTASQDFRSTLESLKAFLQDVHKGDGTIGQMISQRELYDEIVLFVQKLNKFMEILKEHGLLYKPRKSRKSKKKKR